MKSKGLDTLHQGDLISLRMPGAGGYGDPLERDPTRVLADVEDGKVGAESARRDYAVVIDPHTGKLDESATRAERERRRAQGK